MTAAPWVVGVTDMCGVEFLRLLGGFFLIQSSSGSSTSSGRRLENCIC